MHYNPNSHIQSVDDVRLFFHHLIDECKLNFHPDEDFANYTCYTDNDPYLVDLERFSRTEWVPNGNNKRKADNNLNSCCLSFFY